MSIWSIAKLELGRTEHFPAGSANHSYLLRIPLTDDGLIDETAISADPARASVRRFWPHETDQTGYILKAKNGWVFSYAVGEEDDKGLFHLENHPIVEGEYLTIAEPNGERLPYRITAVSPD